MIFLYSLCLLIFLMLVTATRMPKEFTISTEVIIRKPVAEVFNYLKEIRNF